MLQSAKDFDAMLRLPGIQLTDDLALRIGVAEVRLTPSAGFQLAETLLRGATRRAIAEEAASAPRVTAAAPRQRSRRRIAA